jgi:hypothetical protein
VTETTGDWPTADDVFGASPPAWLGWPGACDKVCPLHERRCIQPHTDDVGHACLFCKTTDVDLRIDAARAEGRREVNNAIDFELTCVGCANRLAEELEITHRAEDALAGRLVERLDEAYAESGDRTLLYAKAIVLSTVATSG